jgi:tetratricopeptide (TPR) repeat protein
VDKTRLLERIRKGQIVVEEAFAGLKEAERNQVGTLEKWAAKDVLAHIAAWQLRWVAWLGPLGDGKPLAAEGPEPVEEDNQANARIFAKNQARSWDLVHGDYQTASRQILRLAPLLSEEDLNTPQRFAWLKDRTLARSLAATFYWHVQAHLAYLFVDRKEPARAVEIAEKFAAQVGADEPAAERGTALYNLACFCALAGRSDLALPNLKTALAIHPELIELSKKDTDLDSLRGLPEFKAIYAG